VDVLGESVVVVVVFIVFVVVSFRPVG
jgi:hypothetical protein